MNDQLRFFLDTVELIGHDEDSDLCGARTPLEALSMEVTEHRDA